MSATQFTVNASTSEGMTLGELIEFIQTCEKLDVPRTSPVKAMVKIGGRIKSLRVDADALTAPTA